ncbi:hypothetical protein MM1218R_01500 [Mycobacterium marinum]|uniref:hypothetical protein n=1 Tax=Mycobacterium marinum TaxID=1781 RepID=UPI000E2955C2|nr:hypothetical protein [Mycobacterium marinum]AXN43448.1 hypothetical protein MM1218R_01500 [Mycobacterium marinum]RFZ11500.1 hypothetical protein DE4381_01088 [Mycobacterium marinum]
MSTTDEVIEIHTGDDGERYCKYGHIEATCGEPAIGLPRLMMIDAGRLDKLLTNGPLERIRGGVSSATRDGDTTYLHIDYEGERTTWELHKALFVDGPFKGNDRMWIGSPPEPTTAGD